MVEKPFSLRDIMKLVEKVRSREMKFFTPWAVFDFVMMVPFTKWEQICLDAFAVVEKHLKNIVKESTACIFHRFQPLAAAAEYPPIEILHLTNNIDMQHWRSLTSWQRKLVNLLQSIVAGKKRVLSRKMTITWTTSKEEFGSTCVNNDTPP